MKIIQFKKREKIKGIKRKKGHNQNNKEIIIKIWAKKKMQEKIIKEIRIMRMNKRKQMKYKQ